MSPPPQAHYTGCVTVVIENGGCCCSQSKRVNMSKVTMGFDLQPGSLAAWPARLFQLHKKHP
eukprot:521471-Pelagomonas_calceolata.AAC.1